VPVRDQRHLRNTFRYVLRQEERHGIALDPLHEASNLPDLLRLRVIGAESQGWVRALLPRVDDALLRSMFGDPELDREPTAQEVEGLLAAAAAAAVGLASCDGRTPWAVHARRAAVHAGELSVGRSARALGIGASTARRLKRETPREDLVAAIRLQMRLRAWASRERGRGPG
jgi:hypothetical protein